MTVEESTSIRVYVTRLYPK